MGDKGKQQLGAGPTLMIKKEGGNKWKKGGKQVTNPPRPRIGPGCCDGQGPNSGPARPAKTTGQIVSCLGSTMMRCGRRKKTGGKNKIQTIEASQSEESGQSLETLIRKTVVNVKQIYQKKFPTNKIVKQDFVKAWSKPGQARKHKPYNVFRRLKKRFSEKWG